MVCTRHSARGRRGKCCRLTERLDDVFTVQDEVAQKIASTLFGRIEDARLQLALRKPTDSMAAYDYFLRGLAHFRSYADDAINKPPPCWSRRLPLIPSLCAGPVLPRLCTS